jgi:BMFP domain-containing protein YqiC
MKNLEDPNVVSAAAFPTAALGEPTPRHDIQFMPPGVHKINASRSGKLIKLSMKVHEGTAAVIAKCFQEHMARFQAGEGDRPYFDYNHDDAEASGHPTEFYWAGEDKKTGGVRCKTDWTPPAETKIKNKEFIRFSPQFIPDDASGEVIGMPVNMGGLVNRAAFKSIQPVGAKGVQTQTHKTMDESEMQNTVAAKDREISDLKAKIVTLEASDTVKARDAEITALKAKIVTLEDAQVAAAKENAKTVVAGYVTAGKIPPLDKDAIAAHEAFYLVNPTAAKAVLESLPVNPAFRTVVTGASGAPQVVPAGSTGEDEFVVKAREFGTAHKIEKLSDAQMAFASTPAGQKLYAAYMAKLRTVK